MNVCIIGPQNGGRTTSGVNTFNIFLAQTLRDMGHDVACALPSPPLPLSGEVDGFYTEGLTEASSPLPGMALRMPGFLENMAEQRLGQALYCYDALIVSGAGLACGRILRAFRGRPVLIMTHGQQISPLANWDGAELLQHPKAKYLCINVHHAVEAQLHGLSEKSFRFDLPIPFEPREVKPAGGYAVAVGNLEPRKNHGRIAEIAASLGMPCSVYGAVLDQSVKALVDDAPGLQYMGSLPHDALLDAVAGADFLIHAAEVEGRPMAVLEAQGLGVPCIVPDLPLYREFVEPARNVLLDPEQVAAPQLEDVDWDTMKILENRERLAGETHQTYGMAGFRARLAELLEV